MQAKVSPPARIEYPNSNCLQNRLSPNNPNTTEGMPASMSRLQRSIVAGQPAGLKPSVNITATPNAKGKAAVKLTNTIPRVDTRIGAIPPLRPASSGLANRKSQLST
ncbi:hypothetical protein D3C84_1107740 [compost metagenome]